MNYLEILKKIQELPKTAQGKLYIAFAALFIGVTSLGFWAAKPELTPIYTNLSEKDSGEIFQSLQQSGFNPKLSATGNIMVESTKLYQARYQLATQGLPKSNESPLLTTPPGFGTSSAQEAAYRQAILEKEIAKSILSIQGIHSARVHIAQPKTNVFGKEQTPPSASVIIDSNQINKNQAQAIRHLVSSAIPGLKNENTTIIDSKGASFSHLDSDEEKKNSTPEQLKTLASMRKEYQERIVRLLHPLVGSSGIRAEVDIEATFEDQSTQTESWKPNVGDSAVRSQRLEEQQGTIPAIGGVPGSMSNLPPLSLPPLPSGITPPINAQTLPIAPTLSASSAIPSSKKESLTNYELDRSLTQSTKNGVLIKKIKAAVLLNHKSSTSKDGKQINTPFTPEEISQINALIKESIGFDSARGDSVQVANFPFNITEEPETATSLPFWQNPYILENLAPMFKWLIFFIAMIFGLYLVRKFFIDIIKHLPKTEEAQILNSEENTEIRKKRQIDAEPSVTPDQAKAIAASNPAAVATVIKEWMQEEKSD